MFLNLVNVALKLPNDLTEIVDEIKGLPVQEGFCCTTCHKFVGTTEKGVKNHNTIVHKVTN